MTTIGLINGRESEIWSDTKTIVATVLPPLIRALATDVLFATRKCCIAIVAAKKRKNCVMWAGTSFAKSALFKHWRGETEASALPAEKRQTTYTYLMTNRFAAFVRWKG